MVKFSTIRRFTHEPCSATNLPAIDVTENLHWGGTGAVFFGLAEVFPDINKQVHRVPRPKNIALAPAVHGESGALNHTAVVFPGADDLRAGIRAGDLPVRGWRRRALRRFGACVAAWVAIVVFSDDYNPLVRSSSTPYFFILRHRLVRGMPRILAARTLL